MMSEYRHVVMKAESFDETRLSVKPRAYLRAAASEDGILSPSLDLPDSEEQESSPLSSLGYQPEGTSLPREYYQQTPPALRQYRREKDRSNSKMRRLSYREYKEQAGRNRMKFDFASGDTEMKEMTGFEVPTSDTEESEIDKKPPKGAKSKSYKLPRKLERDMKINFEDHDPPQPNCAAVRQQSSIKVDTPNLFLSLNTHQIRSMKPQIPQSASLDIIDRRRPLAHEPECPQDRLDFYLRFSTIINLGSTNKREKERTSTINRQQSSEQQLFQTERNELIWLGIQAVLRDETMERVDQFLCEERDKLYKVLSDVANYGFSRNPSEDNDDTIDVDHTKTVILDADHVRLLKKAVTEVSQLISQLELLEGLFPTSKALGECFHEYNSQDFKKRMDALVLWLNIVLDLFGRACMMSKILGSHGWHGLGLDCPIIEQARSQERQCGCYSACEDSEGEPEQAPDSARSTEDSISSPEVIRIRPQLQVEGRTVRFASDSAVSELSEPNSPDVDIDGSMNGVLTSTPKGARGLSQRTTAGLLSPHGAAGDARLHYRHFVEKMLKKMGMKKLLQRLYALLGHSLTRAMEVLSDPQIRTDIDKLSQMLGEEESLSSSPSTHLFSSLQFFPQVSEISSTTLDTSEINVCCFEEMKLPSFRPLYLFLIRLPLDIVHECIRLRLEQVLQPEPSFLSIGQLIIECKEVLSGATLVKRYYKHMISRVMWDDEEAEQTLLETDLEMFDCDMRKLMEMYFSYIRKRTADVQNLPDASRNLKNTLEEEWGFTKEICSQIRGGEAEAGNKFCYMASHLLETIGDFLESGITDCVNQLFDATMIDDKDIQLSKIHHSSSQRFNEIRKGIMQTCREFKTLFDEARERASKALGFAKLLRKDLEIAADFNIKVDFESFLMRLKDTGHIKVVTPNPCSSLMFIPASIVEKKEAIVSLLNATCCHDGGVVDGETDQMYTVGYLLLLNRDLNTSGTQWSGTTYQVEPTAETNIALSHIQVDNLLLVVSNSAHLAGQRQAFQAAAGDFVELVNEQTSCHQAIADSLLDLKMKAVSLCDKIAMSIRLVEERLSNEEIHDLDENERVPLQERYTETLRHCYNVGFEYYREITRLVAGESRQRVSRDIMNFAKQWMNFVQTRCERGRGTRPRWATPGLDFLILVVSPASLASMTDEEFNEIRTLMNNCVQHIVGERDQLAVLPPTPNQKSNRYRATSSDRNRNYGRAQSLIEPSNRLSRSSSQLSTHSDSSIIHGRYSVDNYSSSSGGSRYLSPDTNDHVELDIPAVEASDSESENEECSNKPHRIHKAVYHLEHLLQKKLGERRVIGKIHGKPGPDYHSHINVKRANFKWQRGKKVGEGRFGKVYTAVNSNTGDLMAMKVISFQQNDHKTIKNISEEIQLFEAITHPNLVRYYGVEIHKDEIMIFMQFCDGGTIEEMSIQGVPEDLIRKYTRDILIAVNVLHERGIAHRDIKGNNIFLTTTGQLKLGDFGSSAKLMNFSTQPHELNQMAGTTPYMAPEVFTNPTGHGRQADIWSVGCVVIEMFTGKRPWFDKDNEYQIIYAVGNGGRPKYPTGLNPEAVDFLNRCLAHQPEDRDTAEKLLGHPFTKVYLEP